MGIFGSIKNKILGKGEELGDIRSHVLGEELPEREYPGIREEEEERLGPKEVPELPEAIPRGGFGESRYGKPGFGREPIAMEEREPMAIEREPESSKNYEIMDRLNIIEAQLSAIRSQTETINERLKNLEMKIGRRY